MGSDVPAEDVGISDDTKNIICVTLTAAADNICRNAGRDCGGVGRRLSAVFCEGAQYVATRSIRAAWSVRTSGNRGSAPRVLNTPK